MIPQRKSTAVAVVQPTNAEVLPAVYMDTQPSNKTELQSKVDLNNAKTQESPTVAALNVKKAEDIDMDNFFEMKAMKAGKLSAVEID